MSLGPDTRGPDCPVNPLIAELHALGTVPVAGQAPTFGAAALLTESVREVGGVNPYGGSGTEVNAAGTAENVALHVAVIVALALVGVYVFKASGFRFVVAAGVGGTP